MTTYPVGMIEAITEMIGEADTDIGGLYTTRLLAPISDGYELTAVFVWDGTLVVLSSDTTEVAPGDWIRLDADGRYFRIVSEVPNVSVTLENPEGYPIPTGGDSEHHSSKAITSFPVETTHGWDESGQIGIDGVRYSYGSKTDTSFDDVTFLKNGEDHPGAARLHRIESSVLDLNRDRSALDLSRRAMLVDYAEGDDLNALGRNLGVLRLPFLASDEVFRNIVKTLAYNPKGTVYGIQLALGGLVGEGNFEVYEDVLNFPNTVFIRLIGAAATNNTSEGKAYLSGVESQPAASDNTVSVDENLITNGAVGSVRWKDENHTTETQTQKPSADSIEEYDGDPGYNPWTFNGTNEGTQITVQPGGYLEFTTAALALYEHLMRIQPESKASMALTAKLAASGVTDAAPEMGFGFSDGAHRIQVGFRRLNPGYVQIGFADLSTNTFLGATVNKARVAWQTSEIKKTEWGTVQLLVNGALVDELGISAFPADTATVAKFGTFKNLTSGPSNLEVTNVAYFAQTLTDYFSARGSSGDLSTGPDALDTGVTGLFDSGDIGKIVTTQNSAIVNGQGGNNNGNWEVTAVPASDTVELVGQTFPNATVETVNPTRIVVPVEGPLFQFPDDLGKSVEVMNSSLGNNGSWVITDLLEMGTLVSLKTGYATALPTKTNIAVLSGASFVTEPGLDWRLLPNFTTESNVEWVVAGMGSMVGQTITLPQNLPISSSGARRILAVVYSQVLSAQVLLNATIENFIQGGFPVTWEYYPFYLADPLGYVRQYLEEITAAGVIADFQIV